MRSLTPLQVRVSARRKEAQGIVTFQLEDPRGQPLPAFTAGAHIDVHAAPGVIRQYSLCNDPAERHRYVVGVLRAPDSRGGSLAMHERVQVGDLLQISAPRNHFALHPQATRSLLLAGGIGVTPMLAMAEVLAAAGAEFELHYCSRSRARTAFMERIGAARFASKVRFHFDDESPVQRLDLPELLSNPQPGAHLYVCGPEGFMGAVLQTADRQGWTDAQVHREFFSAATAPVDGDAGFELALARSGLTIAVLPGQSAAQALAAAGIAIPTSCEQGICGTCLTPVLAGVPDHRDMVLTPEEQARNDQFAPCCSRAKTPVLVLDL